VCPERWLGGGSVSPEGRSKAAEAAAAGRESRAAKAEGRQTEETGSAGNVDLAQAQRIRLR